MVSVIAKVRGWESKRLLSIAGFLYILLTLVLLVAWVASLIGNQPEISDILLALIVLVIGFGMLIAPLIGLVVRMQHPDLFRKPQATTTAQPSNAPMTPEPEAPGQDTGSAS
jgi:apolipoprotein N-acyltransferase